MTPQNAKLPKKSEYSIKKRFPLAALMGFSYAFTFILFSVFELTISNLTELPFEFYDVLWPTLLCSSALFCIITGILLAVRGKYFAVILSICAGLLLAGYLQGNFMNLNLGELTGDAIDWSKYTVHAVVNTVLWILISAAPLILYFIRKSIWKKVVYILPALLICMQGVALFSLFVSNDLSEKAADYYVSEEGLLELSGDENVLVFLVDRLDGRYIQEIMKDDPTFFDRLDGFTYFPDHVSKYCRTYPSVPYMLTGNITYYEKPGEKFLDYAWSHTNGMLDILRENGFTTKLYVPDYYTYSDASQIAGYADNIADGSIEVDSFELIKKMLRLAAYRNAPHILKSSLWMSSSSFNTVETTPKYRCNDPRFYENLKTHGLSITEKKKNFAFYHLNGCHSPYILNEKAENVPEEQTSRIQNNKGVFKIIMDYLQRMKELGLYENASILITGDHGESTDYYSPEEPITVGLFVKPSGSAGEPLKVSEVPVSHDNFSATIVQLAGIDSENFGPSVFDVKPGDRIPTREFYYRITGNPGVLEKYEITGDSRIFSNWKKVHTYDVGYIYA